MREVPEGIQIRGEVTAEFAEILTPETLGFVARMARELEAEVRRVLQRRGERQAEIAAGKTPGFLPETEGIRKGDWKVAPIPVNLANRRVEITGPAERKMMINALNSGAQVFMADFEDANVPRWDNMVEGQLNLRDAVRRTIRYTAPDGREYRLGDQLATLAVRPRGWHLPETHVLVDGNPVPGPVFDLGVFVFHNARELLDRGDTPHFYLPKLEGYLEARLWNSLFSWAEESLALPRGCLRTTVLIEHVLAAFEMDEILYEMRERITGLNLGRWDYIFSFIKTFSHRSDMTLPDRARLTVPATPFLRAASKLLVHTTHKRGAYALGGMSAYIPRKGDPEVNERALAQVRADKEWEAAEGYDGAWVAHPGLVPEVQAVFDRAFSGPNQLARIPAAEGSAADLVEILEGPITEAGIRTNVSVALQYLGAWLGGQGAVAINNLMEDTATAEISRSQLWQWIRHGATLDDGRPVDAQLYQKIRREELDRLVPLETGETRYREAADLLDELVLSDRFVEFLTLPGHRRLEPAQSQEDIPA